MRVFFKKEIMKTKIIGREIWHPLHPPSLQGFKSAPDYYCTPERQEKKC